MDYIKAIILGVVEGITEFLPVSSTGHLILVNEWISFTKEFTAIFDIFIQLGAILAVLVYFRARLFPFSKNKNKMEKKNSLQLWYKAIIGVIPALFVGALFGKVISTKLFNPMVVATALFVGGIILILVEKRKSYAEVNTVVGISYGKAFMVGVIQCLSMIPGTSRSAATIIGAMLLGTSRVAAVEFSFFLAIPTIFAASAYSFLKIGFHFSSHELVLLAIGFITSFFVAWLLIAGFMSYISKHNFKPFGYYRIILGFIVLLYFSQR